LEQIPDCLLDNERESCCLESVKSNYPSLLALALALGGSLIAVAAASVGIAVARALSASCEATAAHVLPAGGLGHLVSKWKVFR
jgi:hypothetical protein